MANITTKVTKRTVVTEFSKEIELYCMKEMDQLQTLYKQGKITSGQLSLYNVYDCACYQWLHGGREPYTSKKLPCRTHGWAYEETKLLTYRFYLAQFREWVEHSRDFINAVANAHEGKPDMEYIAKRLPLDLITFLEEQHKLGEGPLPKDHTIRQLVKEVQWFKRNCDMNVTDAVGSRAQDKAEANRKQCVTWLKNFHKPEVLG